MTARPRLRALLILTAAASLTAGCTSIREHRGYVMDPVLTAAVQPGVDNRESVQGTLGRPTFTGQFDQRDWYYVSRETRQLAFARPSPVGQDILHIRFNEAGTVEQVSRTGLELARAISPSGDQTPTLGSERSLFEEIFGNIGAVGQRGQAANTPDNPG
ncbi:MAG TPA: outer membrane protein assembly factor BamE [Allosphingosinicella sp.]|jgi:outer membrane protein assembly factor BamE (lipoprotein component of BamABCDE complex)